MIRQYELVELVRSYDPNTDEDALNKAYIYTVKMHGTQKRASGDPYFSHPVEVAGILAGMKLDWKTITAGLLHDTLEDTLATHEELEKQFGPDIVKLVEGVTKLSQLEVQGKAAKQGENFRKLVLAMSEDIRVLLIKLADRLHNMRTLHFIESPEKRQRIARETIELYAPLAERIGISQIKEELQDIAFSELYPDVKDSISARLESLRADGENLSIVDRVIAELKVKLNEGGLENADVYGREKRPYSIWRKMERQHIGFEALADIVAFRILVDNIEECYRALGIIHGSYRAVPELFDDYISNPKPNGYRSLHTTVMGPENRRIEIQIRTHDMHNVNEMGVAAHWAYKQQQGMSDGDQYRWLRQLLTILEQSQAPEEFLEHTKLELFQDQVFCFTPKGELVALPRGATPIDFAYAVHSDVGDSTVGAKVNGRMTPLNHVLRNGDQVEIVRSKKQTPSPTWERFVVTGKARAHIRKYLRMQQRTEYAALGKSMLQKVYDSEGATFTEKAVNGILKKFKTATDEDLYARIGAGSLTAREVFYAIFPGLKDKKPEIADELPSINKPTKSGARISGIPIRGIIPGMALHLARCCHPVIGDRIVGIITTGKGVTVHTIDCETLESFADMPERWLDLSWDSDSQAIETQTGRLSIQLSNATGALSALTTSIAKHDANIINLKVAGRTTDTMDLMVDLQVKDLQHLSNIMAGIRATPHVYSVERIRGK
ncbi:MAG TPA: bifunctional (p)ppGpp synthetase/guanosine-3',5'-bis(diphosphate) 3'-pyrophosphohydrolase [Rhodospirillaceae bacterium]|nr:bifunctional (p)ppGpp synthetase/guanosine-3',5'-bis(diphosphate) 3'-pyrophosphohydrolase [Rhodospirillaceae bacterium]